MRSPAPPNPTLPTPLSRNRDYLVLITAQTVSGIAASLSLFVLPLVAFALTGSAGQAALVGIASGLALWLVTLPAGAYADRWNRKHTMIAAEGLSLASYASLAVAGALGVLTLPHLVVCAFTTQMAGAFFEPAQNAALPRVVATSQLGRATANDQARGSLAGLVGSPLGGLLMGI